MGWTNIKGAGRQDIIAKVVDDSRDPAWRCVSFEVVPTGVWSVWEDRNDPMDRQIMIDLIEPGPGGWGYKTLTESMGPFYHDCPIDFLEMVPVANETWRRMVREVEHRLPKKGVAS